MVCCGILGDIHLGKGLSLGKVGFGSALNSRVSDQVSLLDWTLDRILEAGAEHLILTGDVFEDPKPAPYLIALFISWLKRCEANGVFVYIVIGNHDILRIGNYYTSPLDIVSECELSNVSIYKELTTIYLGSVAITLMPFRDRKSFNLESNAAAVSMLQNSLTYERISIPLTYRKLLVGHFAIEGSIPVGDEIDELTNELFCPIEMFRGYDYTFMGHIHKPQMMSQQPYVAHTGSMDISNFGETEHKKQLILFDPEAEEEIQRINLPTRPLQKVVISVPKDTKDSTKFVMEAIEQDYPDLSKAIIRLDIHLESPELLPTNRSQLEQFLYDRKVFNVSSISESKKLAPIKKDATTSTIDNTMDVPSAIKLWSLQLEEKERARFIEVCLSIKQELALKE